GVVRRLLTIPPDTAVNRQPAAAERVADERVGVLADEVDDGGAVGAGNLVVRRVDVADHFGAAPPRGRVVGITTVAEPELELVRPAPDRLERAAAHVDDVPRLTRRVGEPRAVRLVVEDVDGPVLVGAAARREAVAPAEPGVFGVEEQARPEDVVVFD